MSDTKKNTISAVEAQKWLSSGQAILVDVREPDEFKAGHIAYALSLPLGSFNECMKQLDLQPGSKIVFQCQRGKRGQQACEIAEQASAGYAIYNLEGGIDAWKAAGLPVITSASAKISIFRQVQIIIGTLVLLLVFAGFGGHVWGFALAGVLGGALALAGVTGWCGLAMLLSGAPWNRMKSL